VRSDGNIDQHFVAPWQAEIIDKRSGSVWRTPRRETGDSKNAMTGLRAVGQAEPKNDGNAIAAMIVKDTKTRMLVSSSTVRDQVCRSALGASASAK